MQRISELTRNTYEKLGISPETDAVLMLDGNGEKIVAACVIGAMAIGVGIPQEELIVGYFHGDWTTSSIAEKIDDKLGCKLLTAGMRAGEVMDDSDPDPVFFVDLYQANDALQSLDALYKMIDERQQRICPWDESVASEPTPV